MNMKNIGAFIQASRNRLKLSRQVLGESLSVEEQTVANWEGGSACPSMEDLKNIALLFHCSITDIVNGTQPDHDQSGNMPPEMPEEEKEQVDFSCPVNVTLDYSTSQAISPLLFGDNLEHTRGCIYGGLSAELLRNRKFVGKPGRYGCAHEWYAIGKGNTLSYGTDDVFYSFPFGGSYTRHAEDCKMNRNYECNAQYITNYKPGTAGIGQKDLCLQKDTDYRFEIAAAAHTETVLTIRLMNHDREVYDTKTLTVCTPQYTEESVILHAPCEDSDARLEITFETTGTLMIGALSLMPCNNFHGMRLDVIDKIKELGIKVLRWPGGNFAGEYNWKDGLFPRNMRAPFQSYMWLETQPHSNGYDFHEINTDDFIALCREIGAEPFITLNPTWNSPEESAQWVEYCNGDITTPYGKLRAENGHPEPYNVQFWSLGNEMGFGHMEGGYTSDTYAARVRSHAEKMLEVCPSLTLCSSGPYPNQEWADHSAKALADVASMVSLHHYIGFPGYLDPNNKKAEYEFFIRQIENGFFPQMKMLREQLGCSLVRISYDEWNAWYAWYRGGSVSEGIMTAAFLNMLFRNADRYGVMMACHFESVNEGSIRVFPNHAELSATGQAFSLMKHHADGMVCALQEDVVATRKHSVVTSTLINRSYDTDKKFTLQNCGEVISANLYTSDDVVANTNFRLCELQTQKHDNALEVVVPPHSIAQIITEIF